MSVCSRVNIDGQVQPRGCRGEDSGAEESHYGLDSKCKEVLIFSVLHIIFVNHRQYNQYRRPSEPVQLLEEDGEESRGYGESPEEGYGERVEEERREEPPLSELGETVEDRSRRVHVESKADLADFSRSREEQVKNVVVDE